MPCSINGRDYTQVQNLEIPDEGSTSASKKFWQRKSISKNILPRQRLSQGEKQAFGYTRSVSVRRREEKRYYVMFLTEEDALNQITRAEFKV